MSKAKTTSIKVGTDAKSGQFITVKKAQQRKATAVVETIRIRKRSKV